MKNKMVAALLITTIWLPMVMWVIFNAFGIPDTHPAWNIVVVLVGAGIFLIVPLATFRLLRVK